MKTAIISPSSHYHHLSKKISRQGVSEVYHYGADISTTSEENYYPINFDLPPDSSVEDPLLKILQDIENKSIDLVMASHLMIFRCQSFTRGLTDLGIPFYFPSAELTDIELDKSLTKRILQNLNIPTPSYEKMSGKTLFETFKKMPRPFVIKILNKHLHGRQTTIVDEDNYNDVYHDLFSRHLVDGYKITNISMDDELIIEKFIDIKREYSYHVLVNDRSLKYFGSARDYKRSTENDLGHNVDGMGAYSTKDVDGKVYDYAVKFVDYLKSQDKFYKGFLFFGIAIDHNDEPVVLEINTRAGDPELSTILETVDNDLFDLFYSAAIDDDIPDIEFNDRSAASIVLANRVQDWTKPASYFPTIQNVPRDIIMGIDNMKFSSAKHSTYTTADSDLETAVSRLYNYLDTQNLGQFYYRRDIGILK